MQPIKTIWSMLVGDYPETIPVEFQTRRFLKIAFGKPIFWPRDLLMQPTGTDWTTFVEDQIGIIPVKCGQNPMSGYTGDDE